jgi:hypothetical protein
MTDSAAVADNACCTASERGPMHQDAAPIEQNSRFHAGQEPAACEASPSVAHSVLTMSLRDQNSVTIKSNTNVKDAAGAVCKV